MTTVASAGTLPPAHLSISGALLGARMAMRALPGFPGDVPDTLEAAYDIQDASRAQWPDDVAGWKVGGVPPSFQDRFDALWLTGPVFAQSVVNAVAGEVNPMPVYEGGFAAIEPEFILQMGETRKNDRLFIGAEIASSPVPDLNSYGPTAIASDFGNNCGILIADEVSGNWQDAATATRVETIIDGKSVGVTELEDIRERVAISREFLVDHCAKRGIDLPAGTYISTGAITGVHEAVVGAKSTIDFGSLGGFELELTALNASG